MALNRKYTYDKLGEINGNGLDIALFPQIREAIATRMKEIFGNDIDLSTASADGQYINMESLIFNNMYGLIQYLFNNLNPNTASGKYLDILSSFRNIKRKGPTNSTAQVLVKYTGQALNYAPARIEAQDRNGNQWTWINPRTFGNDNSYQYKFNPGDDPTYLVFTCNQLGPVEAYAGTSTLSLSDPSFWTDPNFNNTNGSIYLELSTKFKLYECSNAVVGTINESDESLRNRGANYFAANSQTTQSGLETAIYNYSGVQDVYVFNNNIGQPKTLVDGATVQNHDVYIAVRYKENVNTNNIDAQIASIIYNKLTPGVITNFTGTIDGGTKIDTQIQLLSGYVCHVVWKRCEATHPDIVIHFTTLNGYIPGDSANYSNYELAIITALTNYFDSLALNERVTSATLQIAMMSGDLKTTGNNTFIPTSAAINSSTEYQLKLTYLKYNNFKFTYVGTSGTLTISFDSSDSSDSSD